MNNKNIWFIYIPLVIIFSFWIWCQRPGLPVEQVLPSHPLFFARLDHVQEHVNQVIDSDFGKNVAGIDMPNILIRNNFSAKDAYDFRHWQNDFIKFWENPFLKRLLRKEAAIAVYRNDDAYQVFIVMRLTLSTRIAEGLGQLFSHWGSDVTVKREKYLGRSINTVLSKKKGLGFSYVRIRDLLIVVPESFGRLEEVVDTYELKHESLQEDPSFIFARQNAYPKAQGLAFYQPEGFPLFGLSYLPGVISRYKIIVGLDDKFLTSGLRKVLDCPAVANDTLKLVPVNAILYNWGICYDFEQSWAVAKQRILERPELAGQLASLKHRFERHFHINIHKDVLPVLGHEIGGYLTDVDMEGKYPFPIPRLLIFIKIQDRAKAESLLGKLTQNSIVTFQNEEYNHVAIRYVSSSIGANIDPGFGFLGDYLLVATSRQLLKRSIDAYDNSLRSIISDDVIDQLGLIKGDKFHSVTLMKTSELSHRAQDFLEWLDKYLSNKITMAAAYQQDGDSKRQVLDEAIADKSAELVLAHKKVVELKTTSLSNLTFEDPTSVNGALENLTREEEDIREDIANYNEQKQDLSRLIDNYAVGAQSDKLMMYNMDNVLSPVLKGLESIDAQVVTVRFGGKTLETEFLVK